MKKLIVATLLFTALSANAGVVRFAAKESYKGGKFAAHHVKHCGPKVAKFAWKVIY